MIFGMWLYLDYLQFKFEFRSGRMTFGWVIAIELIFFVQILSCPFFSLTSFDILTWYLVCGYIKMSYSLNSNFVSVEWFLAELWPLNWYFFFKFQVVRTFGWAMAIELIFFVQILSSPYFSLTSFDILTWYLICGYI